MFPISNATVTSVTSDPFHFLSDADIPSSFAPNSSADFKTPFWESMQQKRSDRSASSNVVKALLHTAAAGGMTQKDFEQSAAGLRPGRKSDADSKMDRLGGFNGRLWHYYTTTEARMSLQTLAEYSTHFAAKGWITPAQAQVTFDYCNEKENALVSVKKMFPANDLFFWDLERLVSSKAK